MRFLSRVFFGWLSFLLIFFTILSSLASSAHAQTPSSPDHIGTQSEKTQQPLVQQFAAPNVEADVPLNQHTFVQSLFLETLLAIQCQITGIDLTDPTKSCLGINLKTGQLGYAPTDPTNQGGLQVGGLLGVAGQGIGLMYTPTFSSQDYVRYLADDFGLVKPTYAAYDGFTGLSPVLGLWKLTRDIAYYLLIVAFIFIGIGVMLRLKIDPRTVMTIQNQIPRVIICIILITFSYAFAGLLIDTMWAVTYMGINRITSASDGVAPDNPANPKVHCENDEYLAQQATQYLLANPLSFANQIYAGDPSLGCLQVWGTLDLAESVSSQVAILTSDIVREFLFPGVGTNCPGGGIPDCLRWSVVMVVEWVGRVVWFLIVFIALVIALFKVWFELLKAYVMVLLYTILAPIWIVFGLLPKRPLGFEKWLRVYFANLAVFPAVVFILVAARVMRELFDTASVLGASTVNNGASVLAESTAAQQRFVPPLIGEPATGTFGAIIEFAMILMAPQLLSLIREKLSVPPNKQTQAALQTFSAGRAAVGAPARQALKHWNKRDQQGFAIGPLARMTDKLTGVVGKIPGFRRQHAINEAEKQHYGGARAYMENEKKYKDARQNWQSQVNPDTKKTFTSKKEFDKKWKGDVSGWARTQGRPTGEDPDFIQNTSGGNSGPGGTGPTGGAPTGGAPGGGTPAGAGGGPGGTGPTTGGGSPAGGPAGSGPGGTGPTGGAPTGDERSHTAHMDVHAGDVTVHGGSAGSPGGTGDTGSTSPHAGEEHPATVTFETHPVTPPVGGEPDSPAPSPASAPPIIVPEPDSPTGGHPSSPTGPRTGGVPPRRPGATEPDEER